MHAKHFLTMNPVTCPEIYVADVEVDSGRLDKRDLIREIFKSPLSMEEFRFLFRGKEELKQFELDGQILARVLAEVVEHLHTF